VLGFNGTRLLSMTAWISEVGKYVAINVYRFTLKAIVLIELSWLKIPSVDQKIIF